MIIVTGANGKLGSAIAHRLLDATPTTQVGVSVRDPEKAGDLAQHGARVRKGDFDDPASLAHAFEGATQVLLVSSNARASGGDAILQHRNAIAAAQRAGARRIVYTSHMAVGHDSLFPPMRDHAATEEMLASSEIAFTALRNGFYADTVTRLLGNALESGRVVAPRDGAVSWTAHADLAEAAVAVLSDEGRFEGPTPPLTASQALDLAAVAKIASRLVGRPIERVEISDEEYHESLLGRGLPESAASISLALFAAVRAGEFAAVDPTLERLLGRPTTPLGEILSTGSDLRESRTRKGEP